MKYIYLNIFIFILFVSLFQLQEIEASYTNCKTSTYTYICPWDSSLNFSGTTYYCYGRSCKERKKGSGGGSSGGFAYGYSHGTVNGYILFGGKGSGGSDKCVPPPSDPPPCPPVDTDKTADQCDDDEEQCDAPSVGENVASEVDLWGLRYYDNQSDLKLAVPGGWLSVDRRYANGSWRMGGTETITVLAKDAQGRARLSLSGNIFTKTNDKAPGTGEEEERFGTFVSEDYYTLQYNMNTCGANDSNCPWYNNHMLVTKPDGSWLRFIGDPNNGGILTATGYQTETHLIFDRGTTWANVSSPPQGYEYPVREILSGLESNPDGTPRTLVYYNYGASYDYDDETWQMIESVTTYDISQVTTPDIQNGQMGVFYEYYRGLNGDPNTGLLKSVTMPDGTSLFYTYDDDRNLVSKTEYAANGNIIEFATIEYHPSSQALDEARRGDMQIGALGGPPKPVAVVSYGDGNSKRFTGDYNETTGGYYSKVNYSNGSVKEVWFDDAENIIQTSLDGQVVHNVANVGRVERVTMRGNSVTIREYDEFDNLIRETLPTGQVRSWVYEAYNENPIPFIQESAADNSDATLALEASNQFFQVEQIRLAAMTDEYGIETLYTYADSNWGTDFNGVSYDTAPYKAIRSVRIVESNGELSRTRWEYYDCLERLVLEISWLGKQTAYSYKDNTTLLSAAWRPDVIAEGSGEPFVMFSRTYDKFGYLQSYTDAAGNVTQYVFNPTGQLLRETDPFNVSTVYQYEGENMVEQEVGRIGDPTDPDYQRGRITRYTYNRNGDVLTVVRVDDNEVEHLFQTNTYNTLGQLVAVTDADSLTIKYTYDNWDNLIATEIPLPAARAADITQEFAIDRAEWNVFGDLIKETNAAGLIKTYTYDKMGRPLTVTEGVDTPGEHGMSYRYDALGNVIETEYDLSDGTTGIMQNTYDDFGRLTSTFGYGVYTETYTYYANDNLESVTNARGLTSTYEYDDFNRLHKVYEDDVLIETRYYDVNGNLIEQIDAEGIHTYFAYDSLNRLTFESTPGDSKPDQWWLNFDNVHLQNEYNRFGQMETVRTAYNQKRIITYDDFGREETLTIPNGATIQYEYTAADRAKRVIYPTVSTSGQGLQSEVVYTYDVYNPSLQTSVKQRSGEIEYYYYDHALRQARVDLPTGSVYTMDYDIFGRIIRERDYASVTDYDARLIYRTTQYSDYDDFDRLLEITLPGDKGTQTMLYNDKGKLVQRSGSQIIPVIYSYDDVGNLRTMQTYYGANDIAAATLSTTEWVYDLRNRLKQKIYPDGNSTDYTYYDNDRLHTRTNARDQVTTYTYDAWGNIDLVDYPAGQTDVNFDYIKGRLDSMTDAAGTSIWTYHPNSGLPASEIRSNLGAMPTTVSWEYDNEGRRIQLTVNGIPGEVQPWQTVYNYDRYGRLELLQDSRAHPTDAFVNSYHPTNGLLEYIDSPWKQNAAEAYLGEQRDYDSFGRIKSRQLNASNQTPIMGANNLQHNEIDLLTGANLFGGVLYAGPQSRVFEYDSYGQLKEQTNDNEIVQHFEFDAMGNRLNSWQGDPSDPATVLDTYVPNNLNQYSRFSRHNAEVTFPVYDEDGNLEQQDGWTYTWDVENRLVAAENPGVTRVEFLYDGEGRRMSKTVLGWDATGNDWLIADRYMFVYDGWKLVAELKLEGSSYEVEASYTWRPNVLQENQDTGGIGGLLAVVQDNGIGNRVYLPAYDFNNNIIGYIDSSNENLVAEYTYDPFGNSINASGTLNNSFSYRFSTKYFDVETEMYYYGHRYYHSDLGRWLNRDPIEEDGGLNLYAFVENDSINFVDPYGHIKVEGFDCVTDRIDLGRKRNTKYERRLNFFARGQITRCSVCCDDSSKGKKTSIQLEAGIYGSMDFPIGAGVYFTGSVRGSGSFNGSFDTCSKYGNKVQTSCGSVSGWVGVKVGIVPPDTLKRTLEISQSLEGNVTGKICSTCNINGCTVRADICINARTRTIVKIGKIFSYNRIRQGKPICRGFDIGSF